MSLQLMGKKRGMISIFDESDSFVVCTVIFAEPNVVVQVKAAGKDGYAALQLGAFKILKLKKGSVKKPLVGHFARAKVEPRRYLAESRIESGEEYQTGQEIALDYFLGCRYVDVSGVSKGKGFQGVMKRHGFSGGPGAHGSKFHRSAGSTGMCSSPGRNLPGGKKAGQMGAKRVKVKNLRVIQIDAERQMMLVRGAIPGPTNGLVYIEKSRKRG